MKQFISFFLALVMIISIFVIPVTANPLDENGDVGGSDPGGSGMYIELWSDAWSGMRITVIDVSDPARIIGGEQWGKVAAGTKSIDITALTSASTFFTRTIAGDGTTPLTYGNKVTHFGKVSKMAYRDGAAIANTTGDYEFYSVAGCPSVLGATQASPQTIKDFINNKAMLTQIAAWCGGGLTYEKLISGKYKILVEPIMYCLIEGYKYAFTATEAALYKPHGNVPGYTLINNTLANAFYLEFDELGWDKWTGATNINQPFNTIVDYLGMHIYSIAPDEPPPPDDPPDDPPPPLPPPPAPTIDEGKLQIIKVEYGTNKKLDGAEFEITRTSHWEYRLVIPVPDSEHPDSIYEWIEVHEVEYIGTYSTVSGVINLDLAPGSFTVREVTPPAGYILDENHVKKIVIPRETPAYTPTLTFENKKLPGLVIKKYDEDTGLPLAGAEFSVAYMGRIIYEGVTPANGVITLTDIAEGWYTITELAAPHGYLKRDESKNVFLFAGESVEIKFDNRRNPALEILKTDAQTKQPLSGAVFRVRETEGKLIGEYVTGADGKITIADLDEKIYSVEEISAPNGYLLDKQHKDVQLEWGKVTQVVFTNVLKPGLTITKYDEATGEPLANAEFSIALKGGSVIHEGKTDANGKIHLSDLAEGWYTVTETAAPHGYLIVNAATDVFLEGGAVVDIRFANRRRPALEILKVDAQTKQPLSGAMFRVWETEGKTVGEYITDENGRILIENLDEIICSVEEIETPDGYVLDAQHKDIRLEWGKTKTLTYTNYKKPGLTITKYDEATGEPLANAEFSIARKGGSVIYEGQTDVNGKIFLSDLAEGWYTVTETAAPYGYLIVSAAKDVYLEGGAVVDVRFANRLRPALEIIKIDAQTKEPLTGAKFRVWETESLTVSEYVTDATGRIFIPNLNEAVYSVEEIEAPEGYILDTQHKDIRLEWGKTKTLTYSDYKKPTLTLHKYDELTNEPLADASFRLWKTEGETWSETQITDTNGVIIWTGLDPGIYSVQEIDEPYGYFKDSTRKEILLNGGDNKQLAFFNRPRPTLTILKRDQITGEPLSGVTFRVQRLEGETIGEFTTDLNGMIELSPKTGYLLDEKIYRVTEITPPVEYLLDVNNIKDVLLKWYESTELVFENVLKPTLIFIKTNGLTGRGIDGATYKVEYEGANGGIVNLGTYKTKCGLIVLTHVIPGWYILTETSPAPGYSLPTNPVQRIYLAPGENSYIYAQTKTELYVDPRTNPNNGSRGNCDWCGYLCSVLCGNSCGTTGFGNMTITNGNGDPLGTTTTPPVTPPVSPPAPEPTKDPDPPSLNGGIIYLNPNFTFITITFGK